MKLSVIGAGRVGRTLARLSVADGHWQVQDVWCRTAVSAEAAAAWIGRGRGVHDLQQLRPADLNVLAVPDHALASMATALAQDSGPWRGTTIIHLSGMHDATALAPLRERGAAVASVHPLKAFSSPEDDLQGFPGTPCPAEGDPAAVNLAADWIAAIGGEVLRFQPRDKRRYHAATVLLSNYPKALAYVAGQWLADGDLSGEGIQRVVTHLLRDSVADVERQGPVATLTGPVERGDESVVEEHIAALAGGDDLAVYTALGRVVVAMAVEKGRLSEAEAEGLRKLMTPEKG